MARENHDARAEKWMAAKPAVGEYSRRMSTMSARRPLAMRVLPLWVRQRVYYRMYARRAGQFTGLFDSASLALAPGVVLSLEPTDVAHQAIAVSGVYEEDVSRRVVKHARNGGLLVDVGANYGYYSCLWTAARPDNRAIAFEASPANVGALRRNAERNGLDSRIRINPMAVGRAQASLAFRLGAKDQTGQGGFAGHGESADTTVPVCTLDAFFADQPNVAIDVLKIDVEGADTWVLEGARGLLSAGRIGHIFFEQYPARMRALGVSPRAAVEILESCGYRARRLAGDEWYATRPAT